MLQPPERVQPDRTRSYSQVTATPPGRDDDRRSNNMSTESTNIQSTSSSNLKTPVEQTQITPMNKLTPQRKQTAPLSDVRKRLAWGDATTENRTNAPKNLNQPGSRVSNEVVMKPAEQWKVVNRERSPRKREAPAESASEKTEYARNRPKRDSKPRDFLKYDKLGGLAEQSEESLVDNMTIEHIANQCCVHFASCGIDCEVEAN